MNNPFLKEDIIQVTANDGYLFSCRVWQPLSYLSSGNIKGNIVCLHGIQSHSGWYVESCRKLSCAGYRVIFPDRRGSGLNSVNRGDMPSWHTLMSDIESVVNYFGTPLKTSIAAISWGAKLGVTICARNYPWLYKAVFITPGVIPKVGFSFIEKLKVAKSVLFNGGMDYLPIPIPNSKYFTFDPYWQNYIDNDEYTLRSCTARFFFNTAKLDKIARDTKTTTDIPCMLLLAESDMIISNNDVIDFFKSKFTNNKNQIKIYPACAHTLEFDHKGLGFVDDIINWLG